MIVVLTKPYKPAIPEDIPYDVPYDEKAYKLSKEYGYPYNRIWYATCLNTRYCTDMNAPVVVHPPQVEKHKRSKSVASPRSYTGFAALRHRCIGHIPALKQVIRIKRGY